MPPQRPYVQGPKVDQSSPYSSPSTPVSLDYGSTRNEYNAFQGPASYAIIQQPNDTVQRIVEIEGTNGAAVPTAGDGWDSGTDGTGTIVYDTGWAPANLTGSASMKLTTPDGTTNPLRIINVAPGVFRGFYSVYWKTDTVTSATANILVAYQQSASGNGGSVRQTSASKFGLGDNTTNVATSTLTIAINTDYRLDWRWDAIGQKATLDIYVGSNKNGTTPDETISGSFNSVTPQAIIDRVRTGLGPSGVAHSEWFDSMWFQTDAMPLPRGSSGNNFTQTLTATAASTLARKSGVTDTTALATASLSGARGSSAADKVTATATTAGARRSAVTMLRGAGVTTAAAVSSLKAKLQTLLASVTTAGARTSQVGIIRSATVTTTGLLARVVGFKRTTTATSTTSPATSRQVAIVRQATATLTALGSFLKAKFQTLTATVTSTGARSSAAGIVRRATVSTTGSVAARLGYLRTVTATVVTSGARRAAVTVTRAATATTTAAQVTLKAKFQTLLATVTTTANDRSAAAKALLAGVTTAGAARRAVGWTRQVGVALTAAQVTLKAKFQTLLASANTTATRGSFAVAGVRSAVASTTAARRGAVGLVRAASSTLVAAGTFVKTGGNAFFQTVTATVTTTASRLSAVGLKRAVASVVKPPPRNANVAPPFNEWVLSGGATVDAAGVLTLPSTGAGAASPIMPIETFANWSWTSEANATAQSNEPTFQPNGGRLAGATYFAADGVTPAANSAAFFNNGNAVVVPIGSWAAASWSYVGGPGVAYIKINLSNDNFYTVGSISFRNPMLRAASGVFAPYLGYSAIRQAVTVTRSSTATTLAARGASALGIIRAATASTTLALRKAVVDGALTATATLTATQLTLKAKFQTLTATVASTAARGSAVAGARAATVTTTLARRSQAALSRSAAVVTSPRALAGVTVVRSAAVTTGAFLRRSVAQVARTATSTVLGLITNVKNTVVQDLVLVIGKPFRAWVASTAPRKWGVGTPIKRAWTATVAPRKWLVGKTTRKWGR